MLMGGTGVGKSTLLNALAGGAIAQASFPRPTTRDPVVYYHESIQPDRLDPALRHCRLVPHDRPAPGAEDPRRYARPRQQRPGQPREAAAPAAGRRRRPLRRLAGEVPRQARLGPVPASSGSGGRSRSCSTSGTAACTPAPAACGPTRTCSATWRARVSDRRCCSAPVPSTGSTRRQAMADRRAARRRAIPRPGPLAGNGPDAAGDRGDQGPRRQPDVAAPATGPAPPPARRIWRRQPGRRSGPGKASSARRQRRRRRCCSTRWSRTSARSSTTSPWKGSAASAG